MALFMIVCPTTGQSVPTGICINGLAWNRDAEFHAYTHCPVCELDHEWAAGDVTLSDESAALDGDCRGRRGPRCELRGT